MSGALCLLSAFCVAVADAPLDLPPGEGPAGYYRIDASREGYKATTWLFIHSPQPGQLVKQTVQRDIVDAEGNTPPLPNDPFAVIGLLLSQRVTTQLADLDGTLVEVRERQSIVRDLDPPQYEVTRLHVEPERLQAFRMQPPSEEKLAGTGVSLIRSEKRPQNVFLEGQPAAVAKLLRDRASRDDFWDAEPAVEIEAVTTEQVPAHAVDVDLQELADEPKQPNRNDLPHVRPSARAVPEKKPSRPNDEGHATFLWGLPTAADVRPTGVFAVEETRGGSSLPPLPGRRVAVIFELQRDEGVAHRTRLVPRRIVAEGLTQIEAAAMEKRAARIADDEELRDWHRVGQAVITVRRVFSVVPTFRIKRGDEPERPEPPPAPRRTYDVDRIVFEGAGFREFALATDAAKSRGGDLVVDIRRGTMHGSRESVEAFLREHAEDDALWEDEGRRYRPFDGTFDVEPSDAAVD